MVNVLISSVVDRGFESWSDLTKDYKICIFSFSAKHAALKGKNKDWLAWNQQNVSKWSNMSTHDGLLFPWPHTIKSNSECWSSWHNVDLVIISLKTNLFSPWYCWISPYRFLLIFCQTSAGYEKMSLASLYLVGCSFCMIYRKRTNTFNSTKIDLPLWFFLYSMDY